MHNLITNKQKIINNPDQHLKKHIITLKKMNLSSKKKES